MILASELDLETEELHAALWISRAGEITNDAFAAARAASQLGQRAHRTSARRFARRRGGPSRPSRAAGRSPRRCSRTRRRAVRGLRAQAELMLERYGIVTREVVLAEGVPGGFTTLYGELSNLEMLGTARRGYFVEGLGGAVRAPGAVERLRSLPDYEGRYLILAAT